MLYPLKFEPIFKDKIWGGQKIKTVLNKDFGNLPNCGEMWALSGFPGSESIVSNGFLAGNDLNELLEVYMDELVGEKIYVDEKMIKKTGSQLFYASVNKENDFVTTTSSRSLAVVGISDTLTEAEQICEKALTYVKGDHIFIRHDIGTPALINKRIENMNRIRGM